jgi:hypothetical protein
VRAESGTGSPSSPAPTIDLPGDIIQSILLSGALSLREVSRMAGTCKLFRRALQAKLDAEVQWLTDLTYRALGYEFVETVITWLTAKPSKRREIFGPGQHKRLDVHYNSASEGSGSRSANHMSEPERQVTLVDTPWFQQDLAKHLQKLPHLVIRGTRRDTMVIGLLARGPYGAHVWVEVTDEACYNIVTFMGLLLITCKRVAESGSERMLGRVWWPPDLVTGTLPPNVEVSRPPENSVRARDTFSVWVRQRKHSFWSQPWGKISKTKRLRQR